MTRPTQLTPAIRNLLGRYGVAELNAMLGYSPWLIRRLHREAGVPMKNLPGRLWTSDEDAMLRHGERPSGRSKSACRERRRKLGIGTTRYWTSREIDLARQDKPVPGRTIGAVRLMRMRLRQADLRNEIARMRIAG